MVEWSDVREILRACASGRDKVIHMLSYHHGAVFLPSFMLFLGGRAWRTLLPSLRTGNECGWSSGGW